MKTKRADKKYCGVDKKLIQTADPKLNKENTLHLLNFIHERYNIHVKKDILGWPAPWTKDPILMRYRFTNVFREDDKVSKSLITMVSHNETLTLEEKVLNTFLFRSWNNPSTFLDFGGPWRVSDIYDGLYLKEKVRPIYRAIQAEYPNRKWWSSAYNQGSTKSVWCTPKGEFISNRNRPMNANKQIKMSYESDIPLRVFHIGPWLEKRDIFNRIVKAKTQADVYQVIQEIPSFSRFLAYQIFVDLTYIPEFKFSENEFTVAGPGCRRGLDALFLDYDGLSHEEAIFWVRDNIHEAFEALYNCGATSYRWDPETLFKTRAKWDRCLNVMCLENCFCELSKYLRAATGIGRPRVTYKPKV